MEADSESLRLLSGPLLNARYADETYVSSITRGEELELRSMSRFTYGYVLHTSEYHPRTESHYATELQPPTGWYCSRWRSSNAEEHRPTHHQFTLESRSRGNSCFPLSLDLSGRLTCPQRLVNKLHNFSALGSWLKQIQTCSTIIGIADMASKFAGVGQNASVHEKCNSTRLTSLK